MPFTVLDLIKLSMLDIGALPTGQTPSTDEQADALKTLNHIIGSWSRVGRQVYTHAVGTFQVTAAVSVYTLGSGGSWNVASRPVGVQPGALSYSGNFQQGVAVLPMQEFQRSITNGQGMTAALPSRIGIDEAAPLRNVQVWPIPNALAYISLPYWLALAQFAAVTDNISFPVEGYEAALRAELAIALAPQFRLPVPPELVGNLQRYMQRLTETNSLIEKLPAQAVPQQQ